MSSTRHKETVFARLYWVVLSSTVDLCHNSNQMRSLTPSFEVVDCIHPCTSVEAVMISLIDLRQLPSV